MNELIKISDTSLSAKEYNGQRVVTFKDIDKVHHRVEGTARKRFNDNKTHFIEGEDYFKVCVSEIRTHKILDISPKAQGDIILLTESGYLMLVKSFTDNLAWQVQRELVKSYFRLKAVQTDEQKKAGLLLRIYDGGQDGIIASKELVDLEVQKATTPLLENINHQQELIKAKDEKLEKCKPFIQFAMKLQNTNDTVSMEQAAKILKEDGIEIGRNTLFKLLREHKVLMENNSPYQKYMDLDLFEIKAVIKEDKNNKEHMFPVTRVTGKGLIFINKKLRDWFNI